MSVCCHMHILKWSQFRILNDVLMILYKYDISRKLFDFLSLLIQPALLRLGSAHSGRFCLILSKNRDALLILLNCGINSTFIKLFWMCCWHVALFRGIISIRKLNDFMCQSSIRNCQLIFGQHLNFRPWINSVLKKWRIEITRYVYIQLKMMMQLE